MRNHESVSRMRQSLTLAAHPRDVSKRKKVDPVEQEPAEEQSIIEEPSSAVPVPESEHQPEENEANSIGDGETVPDEEAARFLHE